MKRDKAIAFIEAVKKVREIMSDDIALENMAIYPEWKENVELSAGNRVVYEDKLYKVIQTHTTQATWTPTNAPTLFEPLDIVNEGTLGNPIIAAIGMTYYKDKYYLDETNGNVYLCTRQDTDEGTVLHHMPSALVGLYFTLA